MAQWRGGRRPVETTAACRAAGGHGVGSGDLGLRDDGEGVVSVDHPTDVHHDIVDDPIVDHPVVDHPVVDHPGVDDWDDGSGDTGRLVDLW